jgi:hypothetical protein
MAGSSKRERRGRRLLVAAIGVATVSYASSQGGCKREPVSSFTSGNLIPPPADAGPPPEQGIDTAPLSITDAWLPPDAGGAKAPR